MTTLSLNSIFARPVEAPAAADEPVPVIVAAPPDLAQAFFAGLSRDAGLRVVTTTRDAADLPDDIRGFRPQLILLSPEVRGYTPALVRQLADWPDHPLAVVGLVPAGGNWGAEMAAQGAVAFFTTPLTPGLADQITRQAPELVGRAREQWRKPLVDGGISARTVEAAGALAYRAGAFVFWSGKGGDGKTSLAVNVACLEALVGQRRVLLIDADMNCGRVALHLDLAPGQNTLFHLASDYRAAGNRLDARMLKRRVVAADRALDPRTKVVESRLEVLLGIAQIQQASSEDLFGRQGMQFMLDLLRLGRELYDFVIVDLGSSTQMGPHFGALQAADSVLLVNTTDRSSLYYNREILRALVREADLRPDKFKLVINRYDPDDRLELKDVAEFMGLPVFAVVPEAGTRAMTAAINQGRPFVLDHLGKNPPETEATLRGLLAVAEGLYPPLGKLIAERNERVGKRGLFTRGAK